jgi:indole-3-glycerol phosphate synthase
MDILEKICVTKRAHIAAQQAILPANQLAALLREVAPPRDFLGVLRAKIYAGEFGLIAEIKKASPSAGLIRPDFDVAAIARAYAAGGATCLSVLTDTPFFQGDDKNIALAKSACPLPMLRKDFMLDVYQVDEARLLGADAILIIMAAVTDEIASAIDARARELDMVSIFEVHDADELGRALSLSVQPQIIGINHRNLKTLEIDLKLSARLAAQIPKNILCIAESGLKTHTDLLRIQKDANINSFLIGETLMKQPDITAATKEILGA